MTPDPHANESGIAVLARTTSRMDPARVERAVELLQRHPRIDAVLVDPARDQLLDVAAQVLVVGGHLRPDVVRRLPNLEWYQQWGAGADWLLRHTWAREAPFVLTNVAGIHATQIGEHVFATLLALVRKLPDAVLAQAERRWHSPDHDAFDELAGGRMLVLGFGAIGGRVVRLARAFGMQVDVIRNRADEPLEGVERVGTQEELMTFLPQADAVVVTLPLTERTRDLIGADALAVMKPSARLVNIGRGGIVVEDALVDALRSGRLAGAALDVFEEEPLPDDASVWNVPNLLITAHYAGSTKHYDARALEVFIENIERWVAEEPLTRVVDKQRGY